jgi:Protein of unknown function (DUF1236)
MDRKSDGVDPVRALVSHSRAAETFAPIDPDAEHPDVPGKFLRGHARHRRNICDDARVARGVPSKEAKMKRYVLGGAIAATVLWPALATAQTTVIETTGAAPPDEVITYVRRETIPSVRVEDDVRVGFTLPGTVQVRTIPRHEKFGFAVVNERRVIVEPSTRRVIRIVE